MSGLPRVGLAADPPRKHIVVEPRVKKQVIAPSIPASHPRMFASADQLRDMRRVVESGREPWQSAWKQLKGRADAHVAAPKSLAPYTGGNHATFFKNCERAGEAVRDLALAWWITNDDAYARRAAEILNGWSTADPLPGTKIEGKTGGGLFVSRTVSQFAWGFDLLHDHAAMTNDVRGAAEKWFRASTDVVRDSITRWEENDYFGKQAYQNHAAAHNFGLMAFGYALGDQDMVQFAVDSPENPRDFVELISGLILVANEKPSHREPPGWPVHAGEIMDRYRHFTDPEAPKGLQYAYLALSLLTVQAELLYQNGVDFYNYGARGGESLELPFAFYADFYRTGDTTLHGGFYAGESWRIGRVGDNVTMWEIAGVRFPRNQRVRHLLDSIDRGNAQPMPILGWPLLLYASPEERMPATRQLPALEAPATAPAQE